MARVKKRRQWGGGELQWWHGGLADPVEGERRRRSKTYATRDEADRVLARIRGDLAQGRTGLPPDPRKLPT